MSVLFAHIPRRSVLCIDRHGLSVEAVLIDEFLGIEMPLFIHRITPANGQKGLAPELEMKVGPPDAAAGAHGTDLFSSFCRLVFLYVDFVQMRAERFDIDGGAYLLHCGQSSQRSPIHTGVVIKWKTWTFTTAMPHPHLRCRLTSRSASLRDWMVDGFTCGLLPVTQNMRKADASSRMAKR